MQKIHHLNGIKRETIFVLLLLGLVNGWICGTFLLTKTIIYPGLVLLFLIHLAIKNGKKGLISLILPFLFSFSIALCLSLMPIRNCYKEIGGVIVMVKNNYYILYDGLRRIYVPEKSCIREVGDIVKIKGYISSPTFAEYESRFSFSDYLYKSGIKESFSTKETLNIFRMPLRLREKELTFLSKFSPLASGTIDMIVFSRKDFYNENVILANQLGCLNMLNSCGIIFGLFLRWIENLFSLKFSKNRSKAIALAIGVLLSLLFVGKIGTYRILLMRTIGIIEISKKEKQSYLTNLSLSGIILFLINPFNSLNSGYLLGFGICFYMYFIKLFIPKLSKNKSRIVSFALLQIFLFPLFVVRGELKVLMPFFSLIFIPLTFSFTFLSVISFLTVPYASLLNSYASFLKDFLEFIDKINFSIPLGEIPKSCVFLFYFAILLILYFLNKGLTNLAKIFSFVQMISIILPSLPIEAFVSQQVSFINVGQGDSILIRDRNTNILIDTGGNLSFDMAKEVLIPFFRKEKVYKIDYLITSHNDYDHVGAKDSLLKNFTVKQLISEPSSFPLEIGNLRFHNYNIYSDGENSNESSLVLGLSFIGKRFLFTGDADSNIEKKIIRDNPDIKADILKVGHHGSKTSSSEAFLKALKPEVAIISVGKNNKYGHPNDEVIKRFEKFKIPYRRTDIEGTITYKTFFDKPLGDL